MYTVHSHFTNLMLLQHVQMHFKPTYVHFMFLFRMTIYLSFHSNSTISVFLEDIYQPLNKRNLIPLPEYLYFLKAVYHNLRINCGKYMYMYQYLHEHVCNVLQLHLL